jgi:hypothetical protein
MIDSSVEHTILFCPGSVFLGDFEVGLNKPHCRYSAKTHYHFGLDYFHLLAEEFYASILKDLEEREAKSDRSSSDGQ